MTLPCFHVARSFTQRLLEGVGRWKIERELGEPIPDRSRLEVVLGPASPAGPERVVVFVAAQVELLLPDGQDDPLLAGFFTDFSVSGLQQTTVR